MAGPTATSPKLWLKADAGVYSDAGTTLAVNNDTVQQWNDQSGNGNNATQSVAGSRPTFKTTQRNGLPAVDFDGTNDYFTSAFTGDPVTVFIVAKPTSTTRFKTLLGADTSDAVAVGAYYFQQNSVGGLGTGLTFARCTSADTTGAADLAAITADASIASGSWYILKGRRDTTTIRALAGQFYGVNSWTNDTGGASLRPITTPIIGAGYYTDAIGDYWTGQMAEILIYDTALSDAETAQVEYYLWRKWGWGAPTLNYLQATWDGVDGGGAEALRMMESEDGAAWYVRPVNYVPTGSHVVRDPSIWYDRANSKYWGAHTRMTGFSTSHDSFDVMSSTDGVSWTYITSVQVVGAVRAWAPESFIDVDGTERIYFSVSTDGTNFTPHVTSPTVADHSAWTVPAAVGGLPTVGENIDYYMVRDGSTYYAWFRNASFRYEVYSSSSPTGGFTSLRASDFQGFATNVEGGSVLKLLNGTWRFYCDKFYGLNYSDQTAGDWRVGGGGGTWSALTAATQINDTFTIRHGTVIYLPVSPQPSGLVSQLGAANIGISRPTFGRWLS